MNSIEHNLRAVDSGSSLRNPVRGVVTLFPTIGEFSTTYQNAVVVETQYATQTIKFWVGDFDEFIVSVGQPFTIRVKNPKQGDPTNL